ncbi:DNA polymerase III subunit delta [[Mycoplasma] gypis]|uniref:DNA polymerase III subunit delta n=1 Tax=[Mycoplasma] gypis TaxID=92404 RepID=A0ABZ2RNM5_9BACT|nr:DNA polymerase III subunit delta [[Mycoplasma] gypis]MBN0919212.1 DNA polymerase III subunit delta [[Mycoplasma] gypis]
MIFIYGDENFFVDFYLNEYLKKNTHILNRIIFDEEEDIDNILESINSISIFDELKIVIIKNSNLLIKSKNNEKQQKQLLDSLSNLEDNIKVIFTFYDSKISKVKKSKVFEFLEKNAKVKLANKILPKDLAPFIHRLVQLNGAVIDNDAVFELITRFPNNLFILNKEIEKYLIQNPQHISLQMVKNDNNFMSENPEFALSDAIIKNNSPKIIYRKFLEQIQKGIAIPLIIGQISSLYETCIEIYQLRKFGFRDQEISNELKIHPYRLKLISEFYAQKGIEEIKGDILLLSQLDRDIKDGYLDEQMAIDRFVLEIIK